MNYIIGKFYEVPAIKVRDWYGFAGYIPVSSPEHEDKEIIGYPWQHLHIDWRFAPAAVWKQAKWRGDDHAYAYVVMRHNTHGEQQAIGEPVNRRMKCKRLLPEYPVEKATWMPKLEKAFACAKLINGTCPHRGISVSAMIQDGDALICPGHGLRWNRHTGELMARGL